MFKKMIFIISFFLFWQMNLFSMNRFPNYHRSNIIFSSEKKVCKKCNEKLKKGKSANIMVCRQCSQKFKIKNAIAPFSNNLFRGEDEVFMTYDRYTIICAGILIAGFLKILICEHLI